MELWYKTRTSTRQRKTLARPLGVSTVLFESERDIELAETGLRTGALRRRADGVVVHPARSWRRDVRSCADGLSTQRAPFSVRAHRAGELEDVTSLQVTGTEWACLGESIRKLAEELQTGLERGFHPSRSIFHGMVSSRKQPQ